MNICANELRSKCEHLLCIEFQMQNNVHLIVSALLSMRGIRYIPLLFVKFPFEFWHRLMNDAPSADDDEFSDEVEMAVSTLCAPPPYNVFVECNRSSPNMKCGSEHVNVATAKTIIPDR